MRELDARGVLSVRSLYVALLACVLATSAARAADTADAQITLAPSRFRVPKTIGPMRYNGEKRYQDARVGRSFGYNAGGNSLNIYVYDNGLTDVPDGPDSVAACMQYESAKREIENSGSYQNVKLRRELARRMSHRPRAGRARGRI